MPPDSITLQEVDHDPFLQLTEVDHNPFAELPPVPVYSFGKPEAPGTTFVRALQNMPMSQHIEDRRDEANAYERALIGSSAGLLRKWNDQTRPIEQDNQPAFNPMPTHP